MKKREIGKTGIFVSEIGFGAAELGHQSDTKFIAFDEAEKIVHKAIDLGCNFFDTAPTYGGGQSEDYLGRALKLKRKNIVLCTKFGNYPGLPKLFSQERLLFSLEYSLKQLRTDYIDVLLLHNPPLEIIEGSNELWDLLEKLKKEGKIRAYGTSVDFAKDLRSSLYQTGSEVVEILFHIFHQEPLEAFREAFDRGVGLIVKAPLDSGWLTGKYNPSTRFIGERERWTETEKARRFDLLEKLNKILSGTVSLTHEALRYVLSYDAVSTVIPGAKSLKQLEDNMTAADSKMPKQIADAIYALWEKEIKGNPLPW